MKFVFLVTVVFTAALAGSLYMLPFSSALPDAVVQNQELSRVRGVLESIDTRNGTLLVAPNIDSQIDGKVRFSYNKNSLWFEVAPKEYSENILSQIQTNEVSLDPALEGEPVVIVRDASDPENMFAHFIFVYRRL